MNMKRLGDILREQREKLGFSVEKVEDATKIRKSYIKDLEEGNYDKLPDPTYIKGFLKIYSEYLGLPIKDTLAFFRREYDESRHKQSQLETKLRPVKEPLIRFSPHVFFSVLFVSAIAVLFAYVWVQYQAFAGAPKLEIFSPKDGIVTNKPDVDVEGKIDGEASLTLNGQSIGLQQDGYFKTTVQLSEGVNVLTFVAVNEVGKPTTVKRVVRFDVSEKEE